MSTHREVVAAASGSAWEVVTTQAGVWRRDEPVMLKHLESGGYP